jgi:hypothetical protein
MTSLDDLMDGLVAEYSDRLAAGRDAGKDDLLARVSEEHRPALARCLRMIEAGLAQAPRAAAALGPGVVLGGFRIERELGRGGMAVVYLAQQPELARRVALKVLRPGLAVEPRHVERFKREALSIARLQHPHIVAVYAVGEDKGWHYLAMEYVEGGNLADVYAALARIPPKARTPQDLARAAGAPSIAELGPTYERALAGLLAPVARAIGVAHEIGIVHRDIKPSNILVHRDGRALVADFGLAKGDGDPELSLSGEPLGTPYYMSPEQAEASANAVDERTDVYSLGVTLYEGLAGARPFEGDTAFAVLDQVRTKTVPPPATFNRAVTADADAVAGRAMARDRTQRYARMLDFATDLAALVAAQPTRALTLEAGIARQLWRAFVAQMRQRPFEYRSRQTLLGWPLVHVYAGPRLDRPRRVARAWFAAGGEFSTGFFAFGSLAIGVFSAGALSLGIFGFGGIALGIATFGGVSAGAWKSNGGVAVSWHEAAGGVAIAHDYAAGGWASAEYVMSDRKRDPEAVEYFRQSWSPLMRLLVAAENR